MNKPAIATALKDLWNQLDDFIEERREPESEDYETLQSTVEDIANHLQIHLGEYDGRFAGNPA